MSVGEKIISAEIVEAEKDKILKLLHDGGVKTSGESIAALQGLVVGELKRMGVDRIQFLDWAGHIWDSTVLVPTERDNLEEPKPGSVH